MTPNYDKLTKVVTGLATIGAAVYLTETGAISGTLAVTMIVGVAAALGAYEVGRRRPGPGEREEAEETGVDR